MTYIPEHESAENFEEERELQGMKSKRPEFKEPQKAFEKAISEGRLSSDQTADNFAGHYMYMGTQLSNEPGKHKDLFKHIMTREYLK